MRKTFKRLVATAAVMTSVFSMAFGVSAFAAEAIIEYKKDDGNYANVTVEVFHSEDQNAKKLELTQMNSNGNAEYKFSYPDNVEYISTCIKIDGKSDLEGKAASTNRRIDAEQLAGLESPIVIRIKEGLDTPSAIEKYQTSSSAAKKTENVEKDRKVGMGAVVVVDVVAIAIIAGVSFMINKDDKKQA